MPKVSVIIPNYNHRRYLSQRIRTVLAQTFQDFELIILDDCSTDGSSEIIEQYRTHTRVTDIVYNTNNSGSTFKQWEKGITLAKGEWIWIAESDDYSDAAFLQTLLGLADKYENIGIAFANSYWVDDQSNIGDDLSLYKQSFFKIGVEEIKEGMLKHCTIQNVSSCIIKRQYALEAVQGLGKYRACGDWIFYTRILQRANLVYTDAQLNYFRWYHQNVSNSAKTKLWTTEGVDILKNINYSLVDLTPLEFFQSVKRWMRKVMKLKVKDRFGAVMTIWYAFIKFLIKQGVARFRKTPCFVG